MKVSHRVAVVSTVIVVIVLSCLSWFQYVNVRTEHLENKEQSVSEATSVMGDQITYWLNGKLAIINMMSESINADFSETTIQDTFNLPLLKKEFILIFGGLDTNGERITNDPSWNPEGWDARKRPWYPVARQNQTAALTDPYADAATKEILISAVANLYDDGEFKGAFGGDLSLKSVSDALNTLNFRETGYAFLLSGDGNIISHPNAELNGQPLSVLFDGSIPELESRFNETTVAGLPVLTSFDKLEGLNGNDWLIGVVLDQSKVMAHTDAFAYTAAGATAFCALLIGILLSMVISKQLEPLDTLRQSLQEINSGDGDLTKRVAINSKDEFGGLSSDFNGFVAYLQSLIGQIKNTSTEIRNSSELTVSNATASSSGIENQLQELNYVSGAMAEMASMSEIVADSAQRASRSAIETDQVAEKGVDAVNKTAKSISTLMVEMEQSVDKVKALAEYSANIESILTVITGIAEQTNLLALNAAIEAARAGEKGRGFAVVADEVRALASRTQSSTEEIKTMIHQLQDGVREAETVILGSRDTASKAQNIAHDADDALKNIRDHITEINMLIADISGSSSKQSNTAAEINQNTANLRAISETLSNQARDQQQRCIGVAELTGKQDDELGKFRV
ncbi:methyl-accepting chemotaxis protein [Enterovibrio norvegicus]|uniref:Methyl-accepting chemotaxis sensory transducer with Cache sensor n=1 Tax=Enterovibrio norvegicus DSM 15893 TaxID=1121869 RepID=A0A1I5WH54_9GAMM|nr:methyl-accepting chemotaxis protein [Enterovibrio norvegicus]SFQ18918.1 methyl-accepting chemotaxis sensory transducer with Cache sensor [Enterovibrio norvegicus DSM 15893]